MGDGEVGRLIGTLLVSQSIISVDVAQDMPGDDATPRGAVGGKRPICETMKGRGNTGDGPPLPAICANN